MAAYTRKMLPNTMRVPGAVKVTQGTLAFLHPPYVEVGPVPVQSMLTASSLRSVEEKYKCSWTMES